MEDPTPYKRIRLSSENTHPSVKQEIQTSVKFEQQQDFGNDRQKNDVHDKPEEKYKTQLAESSRREQVLTMRLAAKEQEIQDYTAQLSHIKKMEMNASSKNLRQALLDPSVNLLFNKMKDELKDTKDKLEQAQSELSAWKFTPDSQTGKKLMSRCRTLIAENKELGEQISQGKVAQLEAELALQKNYNEELKQSQDEVNEFVIQLDEEVEGMHSTIQMLQQRLINTQKELQHYKSIVEENEANFKRERTPTSEYEEIESEERNVQHEDALSRDAYANETSNASFNKDDLIEDRRSVGSSMDEDFQGDLKHEKHEDEYYEKQNQDSDNEQNFSPSSDHVEKNTNSESSENMSDDDNDYANCNKKNSSTASHDSVSPKVFISSTLPDDGTKNEISFEYSERTENIASDAELDNGSMSPVADLELNDQNRTNGDTNHDQEQHEEVLESMPSKLNADIITEHKENGTTVSEKINLKRVSSEISDTELDYNTQNGAIEDTEMV